MDRPTRFIAVDPAGPRPAPIHVCDRCKTQHSPVWRTGPDDTVLCNKWAASTCRLRCSALIASVDAVCGFAGR